MRRGAIPCVVLRSAGIAGATEEDLLEGDDGEGGGERGWKLNGLQRRAFPLQGLFKTNTLLVFRGRLGHPWGGGTPASYCIWTTCWRPLWDYGNLLKLRGFGLRFGLVTEGFDRWKPGQLLRARESRWLSQPDCQKISPRPEPGA